jgi:hypothetical protein
MLLFLCLYLALVWVVFFFFFLFCFVRLFVVSWFDLLFSGSQLLPLSDETKP